MSAWAANHLIEGGGGDKKKTLSESDRSGENVCLLPGRRKSSRARRKSERPAREEGEGKRGRTGVERGQGARPSAHGPRLHDHVVLVL